MAHDQAIGNIVTEGLIGSHIPPLKNTSQADGKPMAVVVHMAPFCHNWPPHAVRSQIEAAFPGIPLIFVDSGTDVQVIFGNPDPVAQVHYAAE